MALDELPCLPRTPPHRVRRVQQPCRRASGITPGARASRAGMAKALPLTTARRLPASESHVPHGEDGRGDLWRALHERRRRAISSAIAKGLICSRCPPVEAVDPVSQRTPRRQDEHRRSGRAASSGDRARRGHRRPAGRDPARSPNTVGARTASLASSARPRISTSMPGTFESFADQRRQLPAVFDDQHTHRGPLPGIDQLRGGRSIRAFLSAFSTPAIPIVSHACISRPQHAVSRLCGCWHLSTACRDTVRTLAANAAQYSAAGTGRCGVSA